MSEFEDSTVNSRYSGHPRDRDLVSVIAGCDQLEASTQHRRDIITCWLDIYNLIGQCYGHVSERNKKASRVKYD